MKGGKSVAYASFFTFIFALMANVTWFTDTTTIPLGASGYELVYSVFWGGDMEERVTLHKIGDDHVLSTGWIGVWKRPYYAGGTVYESQQGDEYHFRVGYQLFTFYPKRDTLVRSPCDRSGIPQSTTLGEELSKQKNDRNFEQLDPGGVSAYGYVARGKIASAPSPSPPDSKYYSNLRFLGKLGVFIVDRKSRSRFDGVGFVPAGSISEPRLGLHFSCG